ncbi:MAG: DNA polymerase/3'-5' exonuclease PolX [Chloroflexi bacterium]|nr:DNA polymerase/3'-5' exonuclease PolX [Chloroflexota bacterium]
MLSNAQLAAIFADIADRLEIQGTENVFAIRAYRTVSENIAAHGRTVADIYRDGGIAALHEVKGIGKEIAKKIESLLNTDVLEFYERLKSEVPDGVVAMLQIPGVGPKRVHEFWKTLGVEGIDTLKAAALAGKLRELPKMGEKAELKILAGIESLKRTTTGRLRVDQVMPVAEIIIAALREIPGVQKIECAGSLRRGRDTIGDLDILIATADPAPVMQVFRSHTLASEVINAGATKSTIHTRDGLQIDLRAIEPAVWGTALQYFTGSQMHNVKVREHAQKLGLSLNEYAVTDVRRDEKFQFDSEEAVYAKLNMAWIPPELREDRGEVEAALDLGPYRIVAPDLIRLEDMRGDLQMHTMWSDGQLDVMGMAREAITLGYEYILITDHSVGVNVVRGVTAEQVRAQGKEIAKVNAALHKEKLTFTVLHGVEVEVHSDGALDLPDDVLAECALVQASVHTLLNSPREKITARTLAAMTNPHIDILGHPSGRRINAREGADYDWERIFAAALEHNVILEINANPDRLDLHDVHARRAAELGCKLSISTDAHNAAMLHNMRYGVTIARRAWITPAQIVNTWPLTKLLKWVRGRG